MKIIALHNLEDIATLLTDITLITEVEVSSVPNIEKFKKYLAKYQFNAVILLDKFFERGIEIVLTSRRAPKAVCVFLQNEEAINKFLRLGVTEANIELLPFNPLTLFVKLRGLVSNVNLIKKLLEEGHIDFDFYRFGLFNVLNVFADTDKSLFLSIKDAEEDKVLYSLRIRNGQVVSASVEPERIIEVNLDDSVPKKIVEEPVAHTDVALFKNTAEFYKSLLEVEMTEATAPVVVKKPELTPKKVDYVKVNPLRERRVYSFPYAGMELYSQPYENLRKPENILFAVTQIDDHILSALRVLKIKGGNFKILTCPLIKSYLKLQGFKENQFFTPEGVKMFEFPNLGSRLECAIYLPDGILITGNLFGSYVSKDTPFFDRVFLSHLRVYHQANITCKGKLEKAIQRLEPLKNSTFYVLPNYGYPIDMTAFDTVLETLSDFQPVEEYVTLEQAWEDLKKILPVKVNSFEEFVLALKKQQPHVIFNLIDEMEVLNIVPYEF